MTKKVTLRVVEKNDLKFLHHLFNNPKIMNYWFEEAHLSYEKLEENYNKTKDDHHTRQFILHNGTESIGFIALYSINFIHRKAEFAIIIDPKQQGKGYAKTATSLAIDYAFRTLNLNKLYLYVDKDNERAIHVYKQLGFKTEALLQDEYFVDGSYRSAAYMSLFQKDKL